MESKYKICVYAISKNEEKFVDRWVDSMSEADMIIVNDTGSTDNTVEKLRSRGVLVYKDKLSPFRFDTARNNCLDKVPFWIDVCVSTDLDEVFEKGWRKIIEDNWTSTMSSLFYIFNWKIDENNNPTHQLYNFKVHSRKNHYWVEPAHEVLEYFGNTPQETKIVTNLILNHYPDNNKGRSFYLNLLELGYKENPNSSRAVHYLAREYWSIGIYDKAIKYYKEYLSMPNSTFKEERGLSFTRLGEMAYTMGKKEEAYNFFKAAIKEIPNKRISYYGLIEMAYSEENWQLLLETVERALLAMEKLLEHPTSEDIWGFKFYDYGAQASYKLGKYELSYEYAKQALELEPNDERLKTNLALTISAILESKKRGLNGVK